MSNEIDKYLKYKKKYLKLKEMKGGKELCFDWFLHFIFLSIQELDPRYRSDMHIHQGFRSCNLWLWKNGHTSRSNDNHLDIYYINREIIGISFTINNRHNEVKVEIDLRRDGNPLKPRLTHKEVAIRIEDLYKYYFNHMSSYNNNSNSNDNNNNNNNNNMGECNDPFMNMIFLSSQNIDRKYRCKIFNNHGNCILRLWKDGHASNRNKNHIDIYYINHLTIGLIFTINNKFDAEDEEIDLRRDGNPLQPRLTPEEVSAMIEVFYRQYYNQRYRRYR